MHNCKDNCYRCLVKKGRYTKCCYDDSIIALQAKDQSRLPDWQKGPSLYRLIKQTKDAYIVVPINNHCKLTMPKFAWERV